jgi:hypothetical protein
VLSSDYPQILRLRPLTGSDEDGIGGFWPRDVELVESTHFESPGLAATGDSNGGMLFHFVTPHALDGRAITTSAAPVPGQEPCSP